MSRFFMDHGMIHDRVTGQHVHTLADIEPGGTERLFALLQELEGGGAYAGRFREIGQRVLDEYWHGPSEGYARALADLKAIVEEGNERFNTNPKTADAREAPPGEEPVNEGESASAGLGPSTMPCVYRSGCKTPRICMRDGYCRTDPKPRMEEGVPFGPAPSSGAGRISAYDHAAVGGKIEKLK